MIKSGKFISILILFSCLATTVVAQDDDNIVEDEESSCVAKLKRAQELYELGKIVGLETQFLDCLEKGFNKEEKVQAYKLLVISNLYDDHLEKADDAFINLLKTDPEYKPNPVDDPKEFVHMFNKFRTEPIFSIGVKAGANLTSVNVLYTFGVNDADDIPGEYEGQYNIQFGLTSDILIKNNFQVNVEALIYQKKISYSADLYDFTQLQADEKQTWLEFPVSLKYNFTQTRFRPYVNAGMSFGLLMSAESELVRTISEKENVTGPSVDVKDQRRTFIYSPFINIGGKYKVGYGYFFLDARFNLGIRNSVDTKDRYINDELLYRYGYLDDDYKLNNYTVSIGYIKNFYKPKKLKKSKWKAF